MKKCFTIFAILFLALLPISVRALSPVGYWRTIDDTNGKPQAIVQLSLNASNELKGHIVKIFQESEEENHQTICTACSGDKQNQPLIGLVFIESLTQSIKNPAVWENGSILDPQDGKTYRCRLEVEETNNKMRVRGYLGLPLLGRTQTWERVNDQKLIH